MKKTFAVLFISLIATLSSAYKSWEIPAVTLSGGGTYTLMSEASAHEGLGSMMTEMVFRNVINQAPAAILKADLAHFYDLGQSIFLTVDVTEPLERWTIQSDLDQQINAIYREQKLYIRVTLSQAKYDPSFVNIVLTDLSGQTTQINTSLNILVESPTASIDIALNPSSLADEIHIGAPQACLGIFTLKSADASSYLLQSMTLGLSLGVGVEGLLITQTTGNTTPHRLIQGIGTEWIISPSVLADAVPKEYKMCIDLSPTIAVGVTTQITVSSIKTHRVSSDRWIDITTNIQSQMMTFVEPEKPVITQLDVPAFVGMDQVISINLNYDVAGGLQSKQDVTCLYRLYDLDLGQLMFEGSLLDLKNIKGLNMSQTTMMRAAGLESAQEQPQGLVHNHRYQMTVKVSGTLSSKQITSSVFQVDLTPPAQPQILSANNQLSVTLAGLDPESGVRALLWESKSVAEPYWKSLLTGNVIVTGAVTLPLNQTGAADTRSYYRLSVQNGAGNWSAYSATILQDIRAQVAQVEGLFNAPNPFDSRQESTTIYYQLNNASKVELIIYSIFGYVVNRWSIPNQPSGAQFVAWDGTNAVGQKVGRGVYYVVLRATSLTGQETKLTTKIAVIH